MYMESGLGAFRNRRATFYRPIVAHAAASGGTVPTPSAPPAAVAPTPAPLPGQYGFMPKICNAPDVPAFSFSQPTNDDLTAYYAAFCDNARTHGVDYTLGMDTHGQAWDPAAWDTLYTRVFSSGVPTPPRSLFPASSVGQPMPLNTYYSVAGPWWAKQMGLSGLGDDTSTTDLSGVITSITGSPTPTCAPGMSYSAAFDTCVSNKGLCDSNYTYNAISDVCVKNPGIMGWLETGNNAVYAALGGVALLALVGMMGRR